MKTISVEVKKVVKETPSATSVFFELPSDAESRYRPGQFITIEVKEEGIAHRRAYSLCTSPHADNMLGFTAKRVQGGLVSNIINEKIKEGDHIDILLPMGQFSPTLHSNFNNHYVLIAGGSGITPLYSILKSVLKVEPKSFVSLIYSNRNAEETIYREDLERWKQEHMGRLRIAYIHSRPEEGYVGPTGRLSPSLLDELIGQLRPVENFNQEHYFICGPTGMMETAAGYLRSKEVEEQYIHMESFTADLDILKSSSDGGVDSADKTRVVKIIYMGDEFEFPVSPGQTILEAGEEAGYDMPYSCRGGVCTACMGQVTSGTVHLKESQQALTDQDIADGYTLTCSCFPTSDDIVIEID